MKYLKPFTLSFSFLILLSSTAIGQPQTADTKFITGDIENFWLAYDACQNKSYTEKQSIFDSLYIKKASNCLQEVLEYKKMQAKNFIDFIESEKDYFSKCRKTSEQASEFETEIKKYYAHFKNIYPSVDLGDVYFMFTAFYTGGQPNKYGIAIGMDYWSKPEYDSVQFTNPLLKQLLS